MKPNTPQSLRDTVLDWFERNPTGATRVVPLAAALKGNADRISQACYKLAEEGLLTRCLITVSAEDRAGTSRKTQWEYRLAAGTMPPAITKPYKPAEAYRRTPNVESVTTQAVSGDVTTAAVHRTTSLEKNSDEGTASIEPPKLDRTPAEAGPCEALPGEAVDALAKNGTAIDMDPTVNESLTLEQRMKQPLVQRAVDLACRNHNKRLDLESEVEALRKQMADLEDDIRRQVQRASAAETNRDHMKQLAEERLVHLIAHEMTIKNWLDLAREFECKSVPELRVFINATLDRINSLKSATGQGDENDERTKQFVVRTPSQPPRFTKRHKTAHAAALSAASRHGMAEVFALVPVGKAVRGAVWKGKTQ